jgi:acyl-CoA synthetase (NDP forming)
VGRKALDNGNHRGVAEPVADADDAFEVADRGQQAERVGPPLHRAGDGHDPRSHRDHKQLRVEPELAGDDFLDDGIPLAGLTPVNSADDAVRAAADLGGPVVLKADVPGLVHKTDAGAVQLDLRTEADIRRACHELTAKFGPHARVLIQPMITGGTEVIIGVAQEPVFGPLVVFGLGGVATDVLADRAARLAPLTDTDADELIRSIRSAPLLLGYRGAQPADVAALQQTLLRVSRLADDIPEIAELDLNPVIARPDGVSAVDARVRLMPVQPQDPFLRRLH